PPAPSASTSADPPLMPPGKDMRMAGDCSTSVPPIPLANAAPYLLVLVDSSKAMGDGLGGGTGTWWSLTSTGLLDLVQRPQTLNASAGLLFFPKATAAESCTSTYAQPDVEISLLGNIGNLVSTTLNGRMPTGPNAVVPALRGAIGHMKSWAST